MLAFKMRVRGNVMLKKIAWKILEKEIDKICQNLTQKTLENENLKQRIRLLQWENEELKWKTKN